MIPGPAETWAMGVGLRSTEKFVDLPPNPKVTRATFLSRPGGCRVTGIPTAIYVFVYFEFLFCEKEYIIQGRLGKNETLIV